MKIEELLEGKEASLEVKIKKVSIFGKTIELRSNVSLETERAIASLIARNSFIKGDRGEIAFYDKGLHKIHRISVLAYTLTNIEVGDGNDIATQLYNSGVWKIIEDNFDKDLIARIDDLTNSYILETKREQKINGSLGYSIKKIIDEMNTGIVDIPEVMEQITNLDKIKSLKEVTE